MATSLDYPDLRDHLKALEKANLLRVVGIPMNTEIWEVENAVDRLSITLMRSRDASAAIML